MILNKYSEKYYDMIVEWQERRGQGFVDKDMLSSNGLVVDDVACGFLYCTDSSIGFMDCFVTNPEASPISKHKAIDMIIKNLFLFAKEMGIKRILANSKYRGIKKLTLKNGFTDLGEFSEFVKEI